jgi:hypothetical protein
MRVERRFLYLGVFLIAIGGVLVSADLRAVDTASLADAVRLWPLALVAIGVGLVLRRTQLGLALGVLAAAVPGVVLGAGLAVVPRFAGDCGARGLPEPIVSEQGTFDGAAEVAVTAGCGSVTVRTAPGNGWRLDVASTLAREPSFAATARTLAVDSVERERLRLLDGRRDTLDLTLPTSRLDELSVAIYGGHGQVDLAGADIGQLEVTANASDIVVDASTAASIADLSGVVNVGALSILLPDADLAGTLRIGGGALRICTPPGLGLRLTTRGQPRQVLVDGLQQTGTDWESDDYASAAHRADLDVHANFSVIQIDPIGGCR